MEQCNIGKTINELILKLLYASHSQPRHLRTFSSKTSLTQIHHKGDLSPIRPR